MKIFPKKCKVIQVVTFLSPIWRPLNPFPGSLNHPKQGTKNCQVPLFSFVLDVAVIYTPADLTP